MKNHRGMKVTCSRTWESMSPIESGRFCDSCSKPVIDFTGRRKEDIRAWFNQQPETCGQFLPHQVDPTLIPIEDIGRSMKRGFLASVLAIGSIQGQAQPAPEPPRTEQTETKPSAAIDVNYPPSKGTWRSTIGRNEHGEHCTVPERVAEPSNRTRVYLSKRFPFVHIRSRTLRGRFAYRPIGCPSF